MLEVSDKVKLISHYKLRSSVGINLKLFI